MLIFWEGFGRKSHQWHISTQSIIMLCYQILYYIIIMFVYVTPNLYCLVILPEKLMAKVLTKLTTTNFFFLQRQKLHYTPLVISYSLGWELIC